MNKENHMQNYVNSSMAGAMAGAAMNVAIGQPPPTSALADIISVLNQCHQTVSDLHGIADRACGIRGEESGNKPVPMPVANGLLDEALDAVTGLNQRLNGLAARFSRVA